MTVVVYERPLGRRQSIGDSASSGGRQYLVSGAADETEARQAVETQSPPEVSGLLRTTVDVEELGGGYFLGTASYADTRSAGQMEAQQVGDSTFAFEIAAQNQHVTQSLATRSYTIRGTAPDFQGAIGVTKDSVEGVDVYFPTYSFSEEHIFSASQITASYKASLFAVCAKTNSGSFRNFAAGEVLFLGASGTKRAKDDWSLSFKFIASPHLDGLTVGSIQNIVKGGWEYLWVRYKDEVDTDANFVVKRPLAVYVEQVYRSADFAALGIGS